MSFLDWTFLISNIVTVVGLPFAILVFLKEQRKERIGDDEEIYLKLSDEYSEFLRTVIQNADLRLMNETDTPATLTPEQEERRDILFELLISIFERAYILVYEDNMDAKYNRLWKSWEDYMRYWCRRPDFRRKLPTILEGEDPDFQICIQKIAREQEAKTKPTNANSI